MVLFCNPVTPSARRTVVTVTALLLSVCIIDYAGSDTSSRTGSSDFSDTVRLGAVLTNASLGIRLNSTIRALQPRKHNLVNVDIDLRVADVNLTEHLSIIKVICGEMLPDGISALVAIIEDDDDVDVHIASGFVSMIAQYTNLPVISLNDARALRSPHPQLGNMDTVSTYLHLGASISDQCKAMMSFLKYYGWHHFIIVTTDLPNHDRFISSLEALAAESSEEASHSEEWEICDRIEIDMRLNLTEQVQLIKESDCTIILLFCSQSEAQEIVRLANLFNLMRQGYVWIAAEVVLGKTDLNEKVDLPPGLLAVKYQSQEYNIEHKIADVTTIYLDGLDKYAANFHSVDMTPPKSCWNDGKATSKRSKQFMEYLSGKTLKTTESKFVFNAEGYLLNTQIAVMNVDASSKWVQVGTWLNDELLINDVTWIGGLHQQPEGLTPHRHLTFTTIREGSYLSTIELSEEECTAGARCRVKDNDTGVYYYQCCIGLTVDLLLQLSMDIGFKYDLYIVEDSKFGAYENGSWNGMVGDILRGKADGAIATMLDTADRSAVIDTSVSYMKSGISVMVKKVEGAVPSDAFLAPFDYTVWLLLTVGIVQAVAVAVFAFECLSPGGYDRTLKGPRATKFTFGSSLWIVWALLFNNTVPLKPPRSYTAKFMTNMWGCFSLIFIAMYTANLVAHMIREAPEDMVDGFLDDKLQNPKHYSQPLKFGTIKSTSVEQYISTVNEEMQTHMEPYNQELAEQAVESLKAGRMDAFLYDEAALRDLAAKDQECSLHVVGKTVGETGFTVALTKGSHWTHKVNEMIIQYTDNGFIQTLVDKWLTSMCDGKGDNSRKPLGIEHSSGVFYLLLGGTAASILIFFGEHLFFKFLKNYFRKTFAKKELVAVVAEAMAHSIYTPARRSGHCPCNNWACRQVSQELDAALARLTELENMLWTSRNGNASTGLLPLHRISSSRQTNHWLPLPQTESEHNDPDGNFSSDSDSQTTEKNFATTSFDTLDNLEKLYDIVESSV
ncbi:glutamate receptor ionotropic, NMDA 2A-like [Ptychodera flava]|uniref:glutamate receptor ionotropic, NMDA 2A-like n=1 Tax=Ptychodera flava TaxID=63121 RepID=UPI003969CF56